MSNIIAIIPSYKKDIGNVNLVYTPHDVTEDARSLRCIINHMARRELLDLPSLRKFLKEILRITKNCPFVIGSETYVFVKTRKSITKNDGCYSIINVHHIDRLTGSMIILTNDLKIHTLEKEDKLRQIVHLGLIAELIIQNKNRFIN